MIVFHINWYHASGVGRVAGNIDNSNDTALMYIVVLLHSCMVLTVLAVKFDSDVQTGPCKYVLAIHG